PLHLPRNPLVSDHCTDLSWPISEQLCLFETELRQIRKLNHARPGSSEVGFWESRPPTDTVLTSGAAQRGCEHESSSTLATARCPVPLLIPVSVLISAHDRP